MPTLLVPVYHNALTMAADAVRSHDKSRALACLGIALKAANAAKSSAHRRAVFRAMNLVRAIKS